MSAANDPLVCLLVGFDDPPSARATVEKLGDALPDEALTLLLSPAWSGTARALRELATRHPIVVTESFGALRFASGPLAALRDSASAAWVRREVAAAEREGDAPALWLIVASASAVRAAEEVLQGANPTACKVIRDPVAQAAAESFPASDPPSWTP